jgi:hypothetical protein
MKRYLFLPFHMTPLLLVATFSIGLIIASKAGLAGIPLAFVLISWFFKYCFVLLDSIITGDEEPPVLSVEMVNPLSEQRPLVIGVLIGAECMGVLALRNHIGTVGVVLAIAVITLALPANIAVLGITRNPVRAIWPPALFDLIKALRHHYVLLNLSTLALAGALYWMVVHEVSLATGLIAAQLLFLIVFCLVGGAVFENRLELGINTRTLKERIAERDAREHETERRHMLDRAYALFRVRKPLEGWREIELWLLRHAQGENQAAEYRALLDAASRWDDVRAADKLANEFIALLLAKRANGEALDIAEQRLATNPLFQPSPISQSLRLAELAGAAGKRSLQRQITASRNARLSSP